MSNAKDTEFGKMLFKDKESFLSITDTVVGECIDIAFKEKTQDKIAELAKDMLLQLQGLTDNQENYRVILAFYLLFTQSIMASVDGLKGEKEN